MIIIVNLSMKILWITILVLTALVTSIELEDIREIETLVEETEVGIECPASHFDLVGRYTLGKQDQLNRTFTHLQQKITQIGNITYNSTPTTKYTIFNARPTFIYLDSKQQAKIAGNDTIVVFGGRLQAIVNFNWTKTTVITRNGTGTAIGLSDMITFAKSITIQNGSSYSYELLDSQDVTWGEGTGEPFKLTRIDPSDATDDDKEVLHRMLNNLLGYKTIRNMLQEEIDKIYTYYLRFSLHDEHHHIAPQFDYIWSSRRNTSNTTISMIRRPLYIDIEEDGIRSAFDVQAEQATNWRCGDRPIPHLPLDPKQYGGLQQFVTYDFYQNMIRFAIEKGYLDVDLQRQHWESTMFQFFAGDLYEIFPKLQEKYYASEAIGGNCKATYNGLKIQKSTHKTFNVSVHFDCELNVKKEKFVDFAVGLQLEIQGKPSSQHWHFHLINHEQFPSFYPYGEFKIENQELAKLMVKHSLNRMYELNLFGNGYPMSPPRDYPQQIAEYNYTITYDSTHIDPDNSLILDQEYLVLDKDRQQTK